MKASLQYCVRFANFCAEHSLQPNKVAELIAKLDTYYRRRVSENAGLTHGSIDSARLAIAGQCGLMGLVMDAEQEEMYMPVITKDGVQLRLPFEF